VTMPTAASVGDGFIIGFRHDGTSLTQVYTIDGNVLSLNGEILWLVSDGTNYLIANRHKFPFLETEQVTTSGTAFDFTGIPPGIKRMRLSFSDVGLSGSDSLLVQLGYSGGFEATGYISSSGLVRNGATSDVTAETTGFHVYINSNNFTGIVQFERMNSSHLWVSSHHGRTTTTRSQVGGGDKTLSGELTQLRVTRSGTDTFDSGSINLSYE